MILLIFILVFALVTYIQIQKLVREKMWGEIAAFSLLMSLGFIYVVAQIFDVGNYINPSNLLKAFIKPVADYFFNNVLGSPFK